jgi:hypothetical protein
MVKIRSPIDNEEKVVTALRARFDLASMHDKKYCANNGLCNVLFCNLMKTGRVNGKNIKDPDSPTGKIIVQLKKDGFWKGELPWEVIKDENKRTSKSIQCN